MKIIGKPYSGAKLDRRETNRIRFDERELEIEPSAATLALYSTAILTLSPTGMGMEFVTALIPKFGGIFCGLVE